MRRAGQKPERCKARDARDQRCLVRGEHDVIINSNGQQALSHHTEFSLWSTPVHDLQIVRALPQDPMSLKQMLDRAAHATPEDIMAGGANTEEELLICLRIGYARACEGNDPGKNDFGFVVWPNGHRAFQAGWERAKLEDTARMIQEARQA